MLTKLLVTTALSGLMLSSALAQSSSPSSSSPSSTTPSASSSDTMKSGSSDTMKSGASKSGTSASSSMSGSASTISSQSADQLLASKVNGADVVGADDKKIGDVSDVLFSKDGKVEAYILSVGGFLGVGAKEVALAPASVQLTQDKDDWKLKVTMTKDQLAQAPNFERYKDKSSTTGTSSTGSGMSSSGSSATAPRNAPNPGGSMSPNSNPGGSTTPARP